MDASFQRAHEKAESKFSREGEGFRANLLGFLNSPNMGGTTVYRYQIGAVFAVKNMLDVDPTTMIKPSLIVAPTGAGKSGMIVMLPYVLQSKKVLILTPSAIISTQLAEAFGSRADKKNCFFLESKICTNKKWLGSFLEDVKLINTSTDTIMEQAMGNLVIVNAQKFAGKSKATLSMKYRDEVTIKNVETFFSQFDTLIVDEAHHYPSSTWKQIVDEFKKNPNRLNKKIVFLTATPCKIDNKGNKVFVVGKDRTAYTITKDMCIGTSIRDLVFDVNKIGHRYYFQDIYETLHEQGQTEKRFIPQAMVLVKLRDEVSTIVEELNRQFGKKYAVGVSGKSKDIAKGLKDFTDGKHRVAVTCQVGLEGYDNTRVTLCVIMRKIVTGKIMFSQFVGRCMRIRKGLKEINGEVVTDRNVGRVISYKKYEQERLRRDYENMDETIASIDPVSDDDEDD